jgi:hypothetical protein
MNCNCKPCLKFIDNKCTVKEISIIDGKCSCFYPDSISYAQHRLYRGIILPAICEAMGESNFQYTHDFVLKPRYLHQINGMAFYEYEEYNQIPDKHQGTGKIWQLDNGHYALIPSMAKFTKKETKEYLEFCEKFLFLDLQGYIKPTDNKEYETLRRRVLK